MEKSLEDKNLKDLFLNLDFHDSSLESFSLSNTIEGKRECVIIINYYNWESNENGEKPWKWRKLKIVFNNLFHCEFNSPDLNNDSFSILDVELDTKIEELMKYEKEKKTKYSKYSSPLLDSSRNFLSIKFNTSNFDDSPFPEQGYLLFIGADVDTEWLNDNTWEGQIHIPARSSKK